MSAREVEIAVVSFAIGLIVSLAVSIAMLMLNG